MKKNLVLIFGGNSCEHDISIISAMQTIKNINEYLYNIYPVYVSKNGKMFLVKNFKNLNLSQEKIPEGKQVNFLSGYNCLFKKGLFGFKKWKKIDVALIVMHGKNGEDGTVAGLLNLCGIPYTSSDVAPSAVCLDKHFFKSMAKSVGAPVIEGLVVKKDDYYFDADNVINLVDSEVGFPLIIKPCNLGSSIGIRVCHNREELSENIEFALKFDKKVIIEEFLEDIKEINVAIFKCDNNLLVSNLEQPISHDEILSFDNKYIQNGQKQGGFLKRKSEPKLSKKVKDEIIDVAKIVYEKLDFKGVVRFDFILSKTNNAIFLNEANSIPGSLANYLFANLNLTFEDQINMQINEGILQQEREEEYIKNFESNVLKSFNINKFNK